MIDLSTRYPLGYHARITKASHQVKEEKTGVGTGIAALENPDGVAAEITSTYTAGAMRLPDAPRLTKIDFAKDT